MDLRAVQLLHHQAIAQGAQLVIAQRRADVGADEAAALKKVGIGDIFVLPTGLHHRDKCVANQRRRNGKWKGIHDTDAWPWSARRLSGTRCFDRLADCPGAQSDIHLTRLGTGDGQHQRSRVAKITIELDRPRALGQLAIQRVQLEIDIGKLLLGVIHRVIELNIDQGKTGEADGADAKVRSRRRFDKGILRHDLFHRPAY